MYWKVINIYNILKQNIIFIGIGLLKKETKNQVTLQKEFYDIYSNNNRFNRIIINIDDDDNFSEENNYLKYQNLDEEINYVSYLIQITQEKLSAFENNNNIINNNGNKLTLTYKDIFEVNEAMNNNENFGLIGAKSEDALKVDLIHSNETKQNIFPKKSDINLYKPQYNDEYLNLCSYSNKLIINSPNNKPIQLEKIDLEAVKAKDSEKEKDLLNNFKMVNEKENIINNNDLINNDNYENKNEINFNPIKYFHTDNKIRKDSVVSDFPYLSNFNSNFIIDPRFNNMNGFNFYNMYLN